MKLVLQPSTLPPIEIEIEGVTYQVKKIGKEGWAQLTAIQKEVEAGNTIRVFDQIPILLDLPEDVQARLDFREVLAISKHISSALYAPYKGVSTDAEKKA